MVPVEGVEPTSHRLRVCCMTVLPNRHKLNKMAERGSLEIPHAISDATVGIRSRCLSFRLISPLLTESVRLERTIPVKEPHFQCGALPILHNSPKFSPFSTFIPKQHHIIM